MRRQLKKYRFISCVFFAKVCALKNRAWLPLILFRPENKAFFKIIILRIRYKHTDTRNILLEGCPLSDQNSDHFEQQWPSQTIDQPFCTDNPPPLKQWAASGGRDLNFLTRSGLEIPLSQRVSQQHVPALMMTSGSLVLMGSWSAWTEN